MSSCTDCQQMTWIFLHFAGTWTYKAISQISFFKSHRLFKKLSFKFIVSLKQDIKITSKTNKVKEPSRNPLCFFKLKEISSPSLLAPLCCRCCYLLPTFCLSLLQIPLQENMICNILSKTLKKNIMHNIMKDQAQNISSKQLSATFKIQLNICKINKIRAFLC